MKLLHDLHREFIVGLHYEYLVIELIKSLQFEYGDALKWVIAYPGDWHMLKN